MFGCQVFGYKRRWAEFWQSRWVPVRNLLRVSGKATAPPATTAQRVSRQLPWVFPVAGLRTLPAIVVVDGIGASVGGASAVASAANLRGDIGGSIARGVDRSSSSPRSSARSNPIVGAGASVSIYWQLDRQHQPASPIFSSQRQLQIIPKRTTILWGCAAFCGS